MTALDYTFWIIIVTLLILLTGSGVGSLFMLKAKTMNQQLVYITDIVKDVHLLLPKDTACAVIGLLCQAIYEEAHYDVEMYNTIHRIKMIVDPYRDAMDLDREYIEAMNQLSDFPESEMAGDELINPYKSC